MLIRVYVCQVRINGYGFAVADGFDDNGEARRFSGEASELAEIGARMDRTGKSIPALVESYQLLDPVSDDEGLPFSIRRQSAEVR